MILQNTLKIDTVMKKSHQLLGILAIATAGLLTACSSKPKAVSDGSSSTLSANGQSLTVCDISKIKDTLEIPLSEWVEDLQIVRFENKDTAFFKLWCPAITDNYIGIRQRDNAVFKLFDRKGKFLCDVGSIGQGPGEYQSLYSEAIDEHNQCIYLAPFFGSTKILKYRMDGTYDSGIEVGERLNKPKLLLNDDGSLFLTHLFFRESSKMLAALIDKEGNVTPCLPSTEAGTNQMNLKGQTIGFDHEIWCYGNTDEPTFMYTYADTLYHYDRKKNQVEAQFTTINGPEKSWKIYTQLPEKYLVYINGVGSFVADMQTESSYFVKLKNDFIGGMSAPTNFSNGYFYAAYEPLQLINRIETRLAESDCTEKDRKVLTELMNSLDENDNNVMFVGKLK